MKEINNFLCVTVPEVDIAAVAAADDKLTPRTVEVHSLHYNHNVTT